MNDPVVGIFYTHKFSPTVIVRRIKYLLIIDQNVIDLSLNKCDCFTYGSYHVFHLDLFIFYFFWVASKQNQRHTRASRSFGVKKKTFRLFFFPPHKTWSRQLRPCTVCRCFCTSLFVPPLPPINTNPPVFPLAANYN